MGFERTASVEEVVTLARSGRILQGLLGALQDEMLVVRSVRRAAAYALLGEIPGTDPDAEYDAEEDEGALSWFDIRSLEASQIRKLAYEYPDYREMRTPFKRQLSEDIDRPIHKRLPMSYGPDPDHLIDFRDEVSSDLVHCAEARALTDGTGLPFWERLFEVYKAGGFPCGWYGKYPDGTLIVYVASGEGPV